MISAKQALQRLKDGNQTFVDHVRTSSTLGGLDAAAELVQEQHPFAIILGCSDARVPAEIVFNQGVGDLFVIRVAGNIATPTQIGSIEYAAVNCGTRLVVVLGHSQCGAVAATLKGLQDGSDMPSPHLGAIVDQVRPSVEGLLKDGMEADALSKAAVRANVDATVDCLSRESAILKDLMDNEGLEIVGAQYRIEDGAVEFFDAS